MRILVLHRVPDSLVRYAGTIDHREHDVTYVGVPDRLATMPAGVPARRLARAGAGDPTAEVLAAVQGMPRPDVVIALSEYDLITAGQVRQRLDVAGQREADVLPARDKVVMKSAVAAAGLRVPRFASLDSALCRNGEPVPWTGRTVLKPRAGASSEGVCVFPGVPEALAAARQPDHVPLDGFEIEEFVEGPIIHVDGLVANGEPLVTQASRYVGTCLGYAEGKPLGSVQIDTAAFLVEWVLRCLRAVGIDTGPYHLEAIETPDGPVFLEVGARFGGADVVDTFELATGVRMPAAQLRLMVDGPQYRPVTRTPRPDERYGWFVFPGHTLGSAYCEVTGVSEARHDPVVRRWVQRAPGEPIKDTITYADSDVPLAGVIGPAPSQVLTQFLDGLFAACRVRPANTVAVP